MAALTYEERLPDGDPSGLLVLHHGRGADELDLLGLADALDPERRLHVVSPRAPLTLPGAPGYHWYIVRVVGRPDPETAPVSYRLLAELHDELWRSTGLTPEQTVLGGFSQGAVMSYALALGGDRPAPAGVLAFSGFVPPLPGWTPALDRPTRAFIAHGRNDPVIGVEFGRAARTLLEEGGLDVSYHESDGGHWIEPEHVHDAAGWLRDVLRRPVA